MNYLGSRILIPSPKIVVLSKITRLFFATVSNSCLSISITLRCASTITYIFMDFYTSTCVFVDSCNYASTMFSSLGFLCVICASIKCCSTTSSSSDFSMNTRFTDVVLGHVCSLAHQHLLLLCKNSITNVLVISILWSIVCANCIFSAYTFLFTHLKDDDECGDNLTNNS